MIDAATFICQPHSFDGKFDIYPPKVKDVVTNPEFMKYVRILTFSQEEIEDEFVNANEGTLPKDTKVPTPLEFLLVNCYKSEEYYKLTREAFEFFIHSKIALLFERRAILIGDPEEVAKNLKSVDDLILLTEENFFDFQNEIRVILGDKKVEKPDPNEHPKIKRMKALARYRDKIKAKQGNGISLSTSLVAICCMGIGITPLNIGEISYAAVFALTRTYQEKEKYNLDIRSLLAGADSKKIKPKYWIRNLDD